MKTLELPFPFIVLALISVIVALIATECAREKTRVIEADHNGHNYLIFRIKGSAEIPIIHDPDCKCHTAERQVEK